MFQGGVSVSSNKCPLVVWLTTASQRFHKARVANFPTSLPLRHNGTGFQTGLETTICRRLLGPSQLSIPFVTNSFFAYMLPWTGWVGVGGPKLCLPPGAGNP